MKENFRPAMNYRDAMEHIRKNVPLDDYLDVFTPSYTSGKKHYFVCPECGSGTGNHHTGALRWDEGSDFLLCYACHKVYHIVDLYEMKFGVDTATAIKFLAKETGIFVEFDKATEKTVSNTDEKENHNKEQGLNQNTVKTAKYDGIGEKPMADYTAYYHHCREHLNDPRAVAYLSARGIPLEVAQQYGLGFDEFADPANAPGVTDGMLNPHPTPRIIIPTSKSHYIGRATSEDVNPMYKKINPKGGTPSIFNLRSVWDDNPERKNHAVFVTEGAFDALSVITAGGQAIALNSTSNDRLLLEEFDLKKPENTLILCLDGDDAGKRCAERLEAGLKSRNIPYITADISNAHKDPNEALQADKNAFFALVEDAKAKAKQVTEPLKIPKWEPMASFITEKMGDCIDGMTANPPRATGFENFDEFTHGGLYAGLYVFGAISGLGKTTFALQVADHIAGQGVPVLFFSLEMSTFELVSKSLSRRIFQNGLGANVTSLGIRYGHYAEAVSASARGYIETIGENLCVVEGSFETDISTIRDTVKEFCEVQEKAENPKPVVFVDYLQVVKPENKRFDAKMAMDEVIVALKRISRDYGITVFVISSINRSNYMTTLGFESFKESGAIEYTADVVLGLQYQILSIDKQFDQDGKQQAKRDKISDEESKDIKKLELRILKNRYGAKTGGKESDKKLYIDFHAKHDYMEVGTPQRIMPKPKEIRH